MSSESMADRESSNSASEIPLYRVALLNLTWLGRTRACPSLFVALEGTTRPADSAGITMAVRWGRRGVDLLSEGHLAV